MTEPVSTPEAPPRVPWDYSVPADPDDATTVENLPTPEGRELGRELARLADIAEARRLEQFPNAHPRCGDCAFRAGTDPNGCVETLMDALKCVVEADPFFCHRHLRDGEPKQLCAGFAALIAEGASR